MFYSVSLKNKTSRNLAILFTILFLISPILMDAQCAMCKAVLENQYDNDGSTMGGGINNGILFLMGIPYLLIGLAIFYFLKFRPKVNS